MAICYAIEDFARGEKYLSELDLDYNNASIMHINPLLRTSNELELKYDWKKWNETRVVNDDNQRQLNLDSYGYVDDDATDYQVIDLYNQKCCLCLKIIIYFLYLSIKSDNSVYQ